MKVLKNAIDLVLQICGKYIASIVLEKLVFYMKKVTVKQQKFNQINLKINLVLLNDSGIGQ